MILPLLGERAGVREEVQLSFRPDGFDARPHPNPLPPSRGNDGDAARHSTVRFANTAACMLQHTVAARNVSA